MAVTRVPQDLGGEERAWFDSAGGALRASEAALDPVTVMRLAAARRRALAAVRERRPANWALPVAIAAGLMAWAVVPRFALHGPAPAAEMAQADALDLLTDRHGPQFYEDLELYQWLEARDGGAA